MSAPEPFHRVRGNRPVVLAMPHSGTFVPGVIFETLNERGRALADTDWHIPRLYDGLLDDVTIVQANFHRYVIDANRPASGESLYPGQNTTGLCPLIDFEGQAIYKTGREPDEGDVAARLERFHAPYHQAIETELTRLKKQHGFAILYDCHSIRSEIDFLFDGTLPDLNIGTFSGQSCAPELAAKVIDVCRSQSAYSHVLNGRFKGGWTTRHYGRPERGIHAIQMEMAQSTYMDEAAPWIYREEIASKVRIVLHEILNAIAATKLN